MIMMIINKKLLQKVCVSIFFWIQHYHLHLITTCGINAKFFYWVETSLKSYI